MCALWTSGNSWDPLGRGACHEGTCILTTILRCDSFFSLCSHRQWRVCKWKCVVPLHCRPLSTMQPWHPNVWVISVFFTTTHSRKKKKSLHFRMFLMKPWQLWTLWKLDPWGQGVLISVYRNEVPIKAPVLHSQVRRWSWGKVLCNFFHRHRFYLTGSWHKIQLHRLEYLAAIFLKMNKVRLSFQGKQLTIFTVHDKIRAFKQVHIRI